MEARNACNDVDNYLILNETGPEASLGPSVGMDGKQVGSMFPCFIDVFKDHHGLSNGLSIMNKYRNLLVNRIVLKKQFALISQVFFHILVGYALEIKGQFYPLGIWTGPHPV